MVYRWLMNGLYTVTGWDGNGWNNCGFRSVYDSQMVSTDGLDRWFGRLMYRPESCKVEELMGARDREKAQ